MDRGGCWQNQSLDHFRFIRNWLNILYTKIEIIAGIQIGAAIIIKPTKINPWIFPLSPNLINFLIHWGYTEISDIDVFVA